MNNEYFQKSNKFQLFIKMSKTEIYINSEINNKIYFM